MTLRWILWIARPMAIFSPYHILELDLGWDFTPTLLTTTQTVGGLSSDFFPPLRQTYQFLTAHPETLHSCSFFSPSTYVVKNNPLRTCGGHSGWLHSSRTEFPCTLSYPRWSSGGPASTIPRGSCPGTFLPPSPAEGSHRDSSPRLYPERGWLVDSHLLWKSHLSCFKHPWRFMTILANASRTRGDVVKKYVLFLASQWWFFLHIQNISISLSCRSLHLVERALKPWKIRKS